MNARCTRLAALALAVLGLVVGLSGCARSPEQTANTNRESLIALFRSYSADENEQTGSAIVQAFRDDPVAFLGSLAATENRELVLMLLGARANAKNPADDVSLINLVNGVDDDQLNPCEREMLGFVRANISNAQSY